MFQTRKYYLLKEAVCGSIYDEDKHIEMFGAEEGSVVTESNSEKQPINKNTLTVSLYNLEHFIIETTYDKLIDISYLEASFLVTVKILKERLEAVTSRKKLDLAIQAEIGNIVRVDGKDCRVNDIGHLNGKAGIYFHITYQV